MSNHSSSKVIDGVTCFSLSTYYSGGKTILIELELTNNIIIKCYFVLCTPCALCRAVGIEIFCKATWDEALCWPPAEAGQTVHLPCPPLNGFDPSSEYNNFMQGGTNVILLLFSYFGKLN